MNQHEVNFFEHFEIQVNEVFSDLFALAEFDEVFRLDRFFVVVEDVLKLPWLFALIWERKLEALVEPLSVVFKSSASLFD